MIFGAIVAGGTGTRMGISDMPKQFLPLGKEKKPIIIHTLEKFLMCTELDFVYLGVHKDWVDYTQELLKKYIINNYQKKIFVVEGGTTRNLTIINMINKIEENHGESSDHILVTHDAVRPFLTLKMIENNIENARKHRVCDTVIPAIDTIIESTNHDFITTVPARKNLYQGQTPQSFYASEFKNLYNNLTPDEQNNFTDACSVFVRNNIPVKLVDGAGFNIKITTVSDYRIANSIIEGDIID